MPPPRPPSDAELVGGLLHHGLDVAYQPIVDLGTGGVVGWEALLRGRLPDHGSFSPEDVVSSAARIGALDRVMRQVCEQALTAAAVVSTLTGRRHTVSVNVEPAQLRTDSAFLRWLADRSARGQADLLVELTERGGSAVWGAEQEEQLDRLDASGVGLAIDDMRAGDWRMSLLERRQWTWVKLDRSFLAATAPGTHLRQTVAAVQTRSAAVVVEGIETEEHLDLARGAGADLGQGHLLGMPVAFEQILPDRRRS